MQSINNKLFKEKFILHLSPDFLVKNLLILNPEKKTLSDDQ